MDLARARSRNPAEVAVERERFTRALQPLIAHPGPKLLITDSQASESVPLGENGGGDRSDSVEQLIPIICFPS